MAKWQLLAVSSDLDHSALRQFTPGASCCKSQRHLLVNIQMPNTNTQSSHTPFSSMYIWHPTVALNLHLVTHNPLQAVALGRENNYPPSQLVVMLQDT